MIIFYLIHLSGPRADLMWKRDHSKVEVVAYDVRALICMLLIILQLFSYVDEFTETPKN